ncbi:MAG: DedA family protein [Eubacteriales bacterium]|nr:DedA family protein [Eubacteriales bacterium]
MDISALSSYFERYGGLAIFLVVLLEYMNLPGFPAGIILPFAGIYAAHGGMSLFLAIGISVLAGEVGSWILYFLGMYGGNAFLNMYLNRFPKHRQAIERTFDLIRRSGFYGIFISKLIPMVRTLISIPAGVLKMEFVKYSIASFLGITLWNTFFVGAGYIMGEPVLNIFTRG